MARASKFIENPTSVEATILWIMNPVISTVLTSFAPSRFASAWRSTFYIALLKTLAASKAETSDFAPVITILPELKIIAVDFGSFIRIMTAGNFLGLNSVFLQPRAILLRSSLRRFNSQVATMLLKLIGLQLMGSLGLEAISIWAWYLVKFFRVTAPSVSSFNFLVIDARLSFSGFLNRLCGVSGFIISDRLS